MYFTYKHYPMMIIRALYSKSSSWKEFIKKITLQNKTIVCFVSQKIVRSWIFTLRILNSDDIYIIIIIHNYKSVLIYLLCYYIFYLVRAPDQSKGKSMNQLKFIIIILLILCEVAALVWDLSIFIKSFTYEYL